jgi:hypothetical protein
MSGNADFYRSDKMNAFPIVTERKSLNINCVPIVSGNFPIVREISSQLYSNGILYIERVRKVSPRSYGGGYFPFHGRDEKVLANDDICE